MTAGQLDEAIAAFERATELNPSFASAHHSLGTSLVYAGRPDEAIASLETAMRLSPHHPNFALLLARVGLAHFAAERYEDAVEWSKRSIRAGIPHAWATVAASYAHLGRLDDARAAVEQLTRHEPDYSVADVELALSAMVPSLLERYLDGLRKAGLKEE